MRRAAAWIAAAAIAGSCTNKAREDGVVVRPGTGTRVLVVEDEPAAFKRLAQELASAGYACLLPNPRGSIGRGHVFNQGVIGGRARQPQPA